MAVVTVCGPRACGCCTFSVSLGLGSRPHRIVSTSVILYKKFFFNYLLLKTRLRVSHLLFPTVVLRTARAHVRLSPAFQRPASVFH